MDNLSPKEKDHKFELVAKELFIGIGGGALGVILSEILTSLIFGWIDLFGEIMFDLIGGYFGMFTAIAIVVYSFLKKRKKQEDFLKNLFQGLLGLVVSVLSFYFLISSLTKSLELPHAFVNISIVVIPLSVTIMSFNYGLFDERIGSSENRI